MPNLNTLPRGGHAPGYLREAFTHWVEAGGQAATGPFGFNEEQRSIHWLIGKLWNTTDTVPNTVCDELDIPSSSSYAQAVRSVSRRLNS